MELFDAIREEKGRVLELLLTEVETRYHQDALMEQPRQHEPFSVSNMDMSKACCFSGRRTEKLAQPKDEYLKRLIGATLDSYEKGYRFYLSGMSRGVGLWACEVVLSLRAFYPDIRLIVAVPFEGMAKRWAQMERQACQMALHQADAVQVLAAQYSPAVYQARNMWLVDHAALVIAVSEADQGGMQNTLRYAQKRGKEIWRV